MSWVSNPSRIFQSRVLSSFWEAPPAESCVLDQDVIVRSGGTVGRRTGRLRVPIVMRERGRRDVTRHLASSSTRAPSWPQLETFQSSSKMASVSVAAWARSLVTSRRARPPPPPPPRHEAWWSAAAPQHHHGFTLPGRSNVYCET